jgi:UDP-3-O-[3-hydroxymyristoyl] N-acetylglucosamine deacetylase
MSVNYRQTTLRKPVSCIGVGLHSGRQIGMTIRPAPANHGIVFVRRDVHDRPAKIAARWHNVSRTDLSTTLSNEHGVSVATVEHLMAALRGCSIDNAIVELDGHELPIMDGSAEPFVRVIRNVGPTELDAPRFVMWLHRVVEVRDGDKLAVLLPGPQSRITVSIDFGERVVGAQSYTFESGRDLFDEELAGARTFGFSNQVEALRARGLALGGSQRNAIVIDESGVTNPGGLRFSDEFARHKVLDCLGDLSLAGVPIMGHFYGYKPGHGLNNALLCALFTQRDAWSYLTMDEYCRIQGIEHGDHGAATG